MGWNLPVCAFAGDSSTCRHECIGLALRGNHRPGDRFLVAVAALIPPGRYGLNKDWSGCSPLALPMPSQPDRDRFGGFLISPEAYAANGHKG